MTKDLRGECQQCGGPYNFPAESTGMTADCPHCGQPTELLPAPPPDAKSPANTRTIIYTILVILILGGGLMGVLMALERAERMSALRKEALTKASALTPVKSTDLFAQAGFSVSPVTLENSQSGSIVHAVGKVQNLANRQRFGVRVELELFDGNGNKVGDAKDYQAVLEPNAEWQFRALVVEKRALVAKVLTIKEAP